ncbi:MAG TPA: DUF4383 domain-containing protein [Pseudonocardiaceae bacterium]|jgi:hypothetical protein|nr:DUF4383 domain-containing protein [Pseudonocardiaceae bacterium]
MMRLHQTGRIVLVVQALLLSALALAGILAAAGSPTGVGHVAGFSLNTPHSVLLLATGVVSGFTALWSRIGRRWAMIQAVLYTLAFVIGTAPSNGRSQDTWLALNTPDHFLHLGLALLGGVLSTALFWPALSGDRAVSRILPGDPPPTEQRSLTSRAEESEETRDMIAAEVAVTEGQATPEQARRVHEDAQHRADADHRRAWKQSDEPMSNGGS